MTDQIKVAALPSRSVLSADLIAISAAAVMGLGLLFAAGFAHGAVMHDVAHDQRHALAFHCH